MLATSTKFDCMLTFNSLDCILKKPQRGQEVEVKAFNSLDCIQE